MKKIVFIAFLFLLLNTSAQHKVNKNSKYLEDQFYVGITYNLLNNKPNSIHLRGFSNTWSIGYIRDIPFNLSRNKGIGIGLGYANNTYFHNMKIAIENNKTIFGNFDDIELYEANKLVFHSLNVPFEIRFRNSNIEKHKFWRFYLGMKLSYVFYHKSQYKLTNEYKFSNFDNFNKLQYGLTASIGHGTWNGYFYYGLTNLFDNAYFNDTEKLDLKSVRFGLIFYIL